MATIRSLHSIIRMGMISYDLMLQAIKVKRTGRTFLTYSTLYSLVNSFVIIKNRTAKPIRVAEFGVGRGGSASILAWLVNRHNAKLTLFDIFGRIPAPTVQDGERALDRYEYIVNHEGEGYYGNIDNLLDLVLAELHKVCRPEKIDIVQGKYEDTLPMMEDGRIFDLVHIDCDWYESSKVVYAYLEHRLADGAIIQIDDYSNWEGSKRAFQETQWLKGCRMHLVDGALVVDTTTKK